MSSAERQTVVEADDPQRLVARLRAATRADAVALGEELLARPIVPPSVAEEAVAGNWSKPPMAAIPGPPIWCRS